MTNDASLPQHAPMISPATKGNSTSKVLDLQCNGHGEVDASKVSTDPPSLQEVCASFHLRVCHFLEAKPETDAVERTQEQAKVALSVMAEALQKYSFDALSFSYNGGKDCLVLLVLYLSAVHTHFSSNPERSFPTYIPSIYAKPPDPFQAVSDFVTSSSVAYHLNLVHIATSPSPDSKSKSHVDPPIQSASDQILWEQPVITFRDAFAIYLNNHPSVEAIFVGTRRTDPHGAKLEHFQMTDGNWPRFMRIHPVIDWRLSEIWIFLKSPHLSDPDTGVRLEYCSIYDEGYTSLGGVNDTLPNPKLKYTDKDGNERYRPAYELVLDEEERLGRE